jgi:hypothetical protein
LLLASPPFDLYTPELIKEGKNMSPVLGFFFLPLTRRKNNMINEDVKEKVKNVSFFLSFLLRAVKVKNVRGGRENK